MSLLSYSRQEVEKMIASGMMRPESLKHYDVCKAMAMGMTQEKTSEKFGYTDDRYVRRIKNKKCKDCSEGSI